MLLRHRIRQFLVISAICLLSIVILVGLPALKSHAGPEAAMPSGQPGSVLTRARFYAMLLDALGIKSRVASRQPFTDVSPESWYAGYLDVAFQDGLLKGVAAGKAMPDAPITRQEAVVILVRTMYFKHLLSLGTIPAKLPVFKDQDVIAPWARKTVSQALAFGLISGYPDGNFRPLKSLSSPEGKELINCLSSYVNGGRFLNPS